MSKPLPVLVALACCLACNASQGSGPSPDAGPSVGRLVPFTPAADADPATLPGLRTDGGALVLTHHPQLQLVWSPPQPGPVTAIAACTRWITGCVTVGQALDDCARSAPACATDQPWSEPACCPPACFQRYAAARLAGTGDQDAFLAAYLSKSDPCVPGLAALLGVRP